MAPGSNAGPAAPRRVGLIGYGYIGKAIADRLRARPQDFALAFVHCRDRQKAGDLADADFLTDLADFAQARPDLVVETAHPVITQQHGAAILRKADYMPLSTGALIDDALRARLLQTAREHGTRLFLPAGALIGGEEMAKRTVPWQRARITFRKHPGNIDFSDVDIDPATIGAATELYRGPVRGIAAKFPRNVNTMVTTALLSTGLDACEGVLVADPSLDCAIAEVEAWGEDGSYIRTEKRQPAVGVSGTEMIDSTWYSVLRASGLPGGAPELV